MRTEHDGVAAFERNQGLVDGGRRRIRGWNDRCNHTDRTGDLEYSLFLVLADNADGFHRPDGAINVVCAEKVLQRFVLDGSIARFFNGKPGEGFRVRNAGF